MKEQKMENHIRLLPVFHFILAPFILILIAGSAVNLYRHWHYGLGLLIPSLLLLGSVCLFVTAFLARSFALKAQDRAIRAEENLRYFAITGSLLDNRITLRQVIALRFAPNNEMLELAHKAVEENLSPKEIKMNIKHWRADNHRV